MDPFQLDDMLRAISFLGVTAAFLTGIPVGWVVVRGVDVESVVWSLVQVGAPFFLVLALTRLAEGAELWEAWLGVAVVYACYAAGLILGFWLRRRTGHRLP